MTRVASFYPFMGKRTKQIGKHIISQQALAGGDIDISVEEAAYRGIIISALQVIQPGIVIVVIAIVANMAGFATSPSAYLFYHFPRLQSRKMPHPGGCGIICYPTTRRLFVRCPVLPGLFIMTV